MRLENGEVLLSWPLALHCLTAGFFYSDGTAHLAIDLRTSQNDSSRKPVFAAEAGVVDWAQDWDGCTKTGMQSYGTGLRIRHEDYRGGSLHTRYAHLSQRLVNAGESVREGQLIGYSGETGNCFGAHLHFEVLWQGRRRNPLCWLDEDFTVAHTGVFLLQPGEHSVKRPAAPAAGEKPKLVLYRIGPASPGDAARLRELAEQLGLPCVAVPEGAA